MSQKVLVTGSSGFIGHHVAQFFSHCGYQVYGTYRNTFPKYLLGCDIKLFCSDLSDVNCLPKKYNILLHCAGDTPVAINKISNAHLEIARNTENLYIHAVEAGASTIIYLSSMSVYGDIMVDTIDEETPVMCKDNYGLSKYFGEKSLEKIIKSYQGITGLCIRMPGVVGPGSKYNFLSRALQKIMTQQEIIAEHPNNLFNNIVHIFDLANFMMLYSKRGNNKFEVTNIASKNPLTIKSVLQLMQDFVGKKTSVTFKPSLRKPFLIDLKKVQSLNYLPSSVFSSLQRFVADNAK